MKFTEDRTKITRIAAFNRTTQELKYNTLLAEKQALMAFNRTTQELKYEKFGIDMAALTPSIAPHRN